MPVDNNVAARLTDVTVHTESGALGPWTLAVHPGECVVLTGDNGAGKSTLLRVCCGLLPPSSGSVFASTSRSLAPEPFHTPRGLRTSQLLTHIYQSTGQSRPDAVTALCSQDLVESRLDHLSRGQLKRVVIAQAFIGSPTLLLLDEPLEGLDRSGVQTVTALVHAHVDAGGCALIATHRAEAWAHKHTREFGVETG